MAKTKGTKANDSPAAAAKPAPKADTPAYTVVARRYRPQQFADLVGQEHVAQALTNAITSGRIAHAYLFTGARGTGKTSTARILAKALNCEKGPTPTPCDARSTSRINSVGTATCGDSKAKRFAIRCCRSPARWTSRCSAPAR